MEQRLPSQNEISRRLRKHTSFYQCHSAMSEVSEPVTYKEAMNRSDADKWTEAINREPQTIKDNHTWQVCDAPVSSKISSKCN